MDRFGHVAWIRMRPTPSIGRMTWVCPNVPSPSNRPRAVHGAGACERFHPRGIPSKTTISHLVDISHVHGAAPLDRLFCTFDRGSSHHVALASPADRPSQQNRPKQTPSLLEGGSQSETQTWHGLGGRKGQRERGREWESGRGGEREREGERERVGERGGESGQGERERVGERGGESGQGERVERGRGGEGEREAEDVCDRSFGDGGACSCRSQANGRKRERDDRKERGEGKDTRPIGEMGQRRTRRSRGLAGKRTRTWVRAAADEAKMVDVVVWDVDETGKKVVKQAGPVRRQSDGRKRESPPNPPTNQKNLP
eukprot:scaffold2636_cov340-Pavlova_lutheri.AAC.153